MLQERDIYKILHATYSLNRISKEKKKKKNKEYQKENYSLTQEIKKEEKEIYQLKYLGLSIIIYYTEIEIEDHFQNKQMYWYLEFGRYKYHLEYCQIPSQRNDILFKKTNKFLNEVYDVDTAKKIILHYLKKLQKNPDFMDFQETLLLNIKYNILPH